MRERASARDIVCEREKARDRERGMSGGRRRGGVEKREVKVGVWD